jgi:excisionase family DNA binding protein
MNSVLDSSNPHRLMSLASRINAIHRALNAEELAELLQVSRLTILRRAKRGSIPSFRVGSCVRFDSAAIAKWLMQQGVQSMSNPTSSALARTSKKAGR